MSRALIMGLWRVVIVTASIFALVACGAKALDPERVDTVTSDYILRDLATTIVQCDSTVVSVEKVKLTRQDYIPIAIVDCTLSDGTATRQFYGFDLQTISRVHEIVKEQPAIDTQSLALLVGTSAPHAEAMRQIVILATR